MFVSQSLKQDLAEFGNLLGMLLIEVELASQIDSGSNHLIGEVFVPSSASRHLFQQPVAQIDARNDDFLELKCVSKHHIGQQCGAEGPSIGERDVIFVNQFIFVQRQDRIGQFFQCRQRDGSQMARVPVRNQLLSGKPHVPTQDDHFL